VSSPIRIRRAAPGDLPVLGSLGAALMRAHFAFDPDRFLAPGDRAEEGYAAFLESELTAAETAIFVADREGEVLGYVYAAIEPMSWKELRDRAGFIHDIVVSEPARRSKVATSLMDAAVEWIRAQGVARVLLWTAAPNAAAQRLFAGLGFRPTMIEMTREL
jgi:ribosomal protein S18 acetylase RimI-like enzyme